MRGNERTLTARRSPRMGDPPFTVGGGSWVVGGSWAVGRRSWVVGGGGSVAGVRWRWPGGWCAVVVGPGRPVCGGCRAWPPGIRAGAVGVRANAFRACVCHSARPCVVVSVRTRTRSCFTYVSFVSPDLVGRGSSPRPGWAGFVSPGLVGRGSSPRPGWRGSSPPAWLGRRWGSDVVDALLHGGPPWASLGNKKGRSL